MHSALSASLALRFLCCFLGVNIKHRLSALPKSEAFKFIAPLTSAHPSVSSKNFPQRKCVTATEFFFPKQPTNAQHVIANLEKLLGTSTSLQTWKSCLVLHLLPYQLVKKPLSPSSLTFIVG